MATARPPATPSVDLIVRDLYGALLDDVSFRPCLQTLGRAFSSHITAIHSEELLQRSSGLDMMGEIEGQEFLQLAEDYSRRWVGQNLWIERGIPNLLQKGYGVGDEVVSETELFTSDYYRHFLKPIDIRHGLGVNVQCNGASSLAILSINRSARAGPFTIEELVLIEALRPHLVNAYAIYRRIAQLKDETMTLRCSFDRMPLGTIILDADGCIVEQNEEASRLMLSGVEIAYASGGHLRLSNPAAHAKYRAAIVRLTDKNQIPVPEAIVIGSRDMLSNSLVLHLCGFPALTTPLFVKKGRIIAFLCELSCHSKSQFAAHVLHATLDLTPTEVAVVLCLRDHHDPMHVALELGLAISTVRSHLRHLFRKTDTRRQSDLLLLIERLLSAVPN